MLMMMMARLKIYLHSLNPLSQSHQRGSNAATTHIIPVFSDQLAEDLMVAVKEERGRRLHKNVTLLRLSSGLRSWEVRLDPHG